MTVRRSEAGMCPKCFELFGLQVHWYGVLMAMGFAAGLLNWVCLGRREGRDLNFCSDLLFWVMVSGILGARIAYVLHELPAYVENPISVLFIHKGGLIYYGGFLLGGVAICAFARKHRIRVLDLLDFVITSVPLAHAFGRVGCFLNGCCYGRVTDVPWGIRYPAESSVWWGQVMQDSLLRFKPASLPVHPVQLYEVAFNLLVYAALWVHYRRRSRSGSTTALYLFLYPVGRFILESLRGDKRAVWFGVSISQWVSIFLIVLGLALWQQSRRPAALIRGQE
jgi:phosphatidylglycerol:prolipoprotein diacylglycerol transferase